MEFYVRKFHDTWKDWVDFKIVNSKDITLSRLNIIKNNPKLAITFVRYNSFPPNDLTEEQILFMVENIDDLFWKSENDKEDEEENGSDYVTSFLKTIHLRRKDLSESTWLYLTMRLPSFFMN